ncbi:hypothetical protein PO439_21780 [Escherichia coli]
MRQQQDEPGRFSICSRQAAVVHTELKARQAALDKALRDATDAREAKATLTGELQSLKTHNDQLAALLAGKK